VTEKLTELITTIRQDKKLLNYDEATTKQTIILRLLSILGWDIFSAVEVTPEYSVEQKKVDYALRSKEVMVFLEVKKPKEDLENHEEQLLEYAFRQGAKLAVLTNGLTWWFYLPMSEGSWSSRKFYTIDVLEQDIDSIIKNFIGFLSKENIVNGTALKTARAMHESKLKRGKILESLPEAWNKILSDKDSLIIDILSDSTEKICGFRPEKAEVADFLSENRDRLILDTVYDLQEQQILAQKKGANIAAQHHVAAIKLPASRGGGLIRIRLDNDIIEATSIPKLYLKVLQTVVDNGRIKKLEIPWGVGTKRYLIFQGHNPMHPHGRAFFQPVEYHNYHMETHVNRASGVKYLGEFCAELGYDYEVLEV
jgi:predicted type IV restriction endonuclease